MGKHKIFVYAISKNEEKFADRWMDSVSEADGIIVVDTGSQDDTVAMLRSRGALVYEEKITPWRFDTARNIALDYVPEDADICVSVDIDEVFSPGWRARLETAWHAECSRAKYWYYWDEDAETKFIREKIHRRHGFRWVNPVHEVLEYSGDIKEKSVFVEGMTLYHKPDNAKSRAQYLPLLEMSAKENPDDDRTRFWLGREYVYKGLYDEGISTLKEHLDMPTAKWDEERAASCRFIARAHQAKEDNNAALTWLYRAAAECPGVREAWLDMARLAYDAENWPLAYFAAKKGLDIVSPSDSYLVEPDAWGYKLDDLAAIACYQLGFYNKALEHARNACDIAPGDERLRKNLEIITTKLDRGGADESS